MRAKNLVKRVSRLGIMLVPVLMLAACLTVNTPSLPRMYVGKGVSVPIKVTGGKGPLTFSATGLPNGLTIDHATGVVSGVPQASGSFTASVTITDPADNNATLVKDYDLTVANPAPLVRAGDFGEFDGPSISDDGRFVALAPNGQVVVWDRTTGTRTPIAAGNGYSIRPAISGDGRYVAFLSQATDLVPGDTNGQSDIFVRDLVAKTTTRLTNGFTGDCTGCYAPEISDDGRYVSYESDATNIVPGDTNGAEDIFVWDRTTLTTARITSGNSWSTQPSMSGDGRVIAFTSNASNLVSGDTNSLPDLFSWDRSTGSIVRITEGYCYPAISADGNFVLCSSLDGSTLWDRLKGTGALITPYDASYARVSRDGRYVAFASSAANLVPGGDGNGDQMDVFLWDSASGGITRITRGNAESNYPAITDDGRYVAFSSYATDLPGDPSGLGGALVWDQLS